MGKKKYTQEFKEQAVKLSQRGEKSIQQLAADLGIATSVLHRWRRESGESQEGRGGKRRAFPGHGRSRDEEVEGLRKALRQAEQERDILKKAVGYFAQHSK